MESLDIEKIHNWIQDFIHSDQYRSHSPLLQEYIPTFLSDLYTKAYRDSQSTPDAIDWNFFKTAIGTTLKQDSYPNSVKEKLPEVAALLFEFLEGQGRLADGHELAMQVRSSSWSFKPETIRRENTKLNRNDPCPCGSGKKYKKCCMNLLK